MNVRTWGSPTLLLAACGCSMCQSPWDYSGPTAGSPPANYGQTTQRAGSVLNGGGMATNPTPAPDIPPQTLPTKPPLQPYTDPVARQVKPMQPVQR